MKKTLSLVVNHWVGEFNSAFASIASALSAWLAPVPEAAMTAIAIGKIFELKPLFSIFIAASIELVGVSVNEYFQDATAFNENEKIHKEKRGAKNYRHPLENVRSAKVFVWAFYIVTGIIVAVTAAYEVFYEEKLPIKLLAALFPVASAIGTITMNRRAALHRKKVQIDSAAKQIVRNEPKKERLRTESVKKGRMSAQDWREFVRNPDGSVDLVRKFKTEPRGIHAGIVNEIMDRAGFARLPVSTARDRAKMARIELGVENGSQK